VRKRFFPAIAPLGCLTALAFFLVACSDSAPSRSLTLASGAELRWSPTEPKIGDLVAFEVVLPVAPATTVAPDDAMAVLSPDGQTIAPVDFRYGADGRRLERWSFRVTAAGDWIAKLSDKRQILFAVETVAGKATELREQDPVWLWTGKKPAGAASGKPSTGMPGPGGSPVSTPAPAGSTAPTTSAAPGVTP